MAIPPMSFASPISNGGKSQTQLPTDPKENKKAVAKMQLEAIFDQLEAMRKKVEKRAEKAMKGDHSADEL